MNSKSAYIVLGVFIVTTMTLAAFTQDDARHLLAGVRGGQLWDKWWVAADLPEPVGDHPLYPAIGQKSGSTTWRCKECHGWDYKGVDGAYGSGSHYTGIGGVFDTEKTGLQMFNLIKSDQMIYGHGFGNAGLSEADIKNLVEFIQGCVIDTDEYIDTNGDFIGDADEGRYNYKAGGGYYSCATCHGEDGTEINFGTDENPKYLRDIAVDNPWEMLHKTRFGQPGTYMPIWEFRHDIQGAADLGWYVQADFPGPDYVGDGTCVECHADSPMPDFYAGYKRSGHPYKLNHTGGQVPPIDLWPFTPVPPLPIVYDTQLEWSGVEYVIGNYFWKARFIDRDGYIYTGDVDETTQWNLATQNWSAYHAGEVEKPYDCGRCHTTGYQPEGNQNGLPGLIGTWTEDGVRCEACHGPAEDHVINPEVMATLGGKDCAECHYRDADFRMPWKGGFTRHHQQAEDLRHSPHDGRVGCNSCHDPHRSTVYDDGGVIAQCTDCHEGNEENGFYLVEQMEEVACIDCHMPYMGKSAVAVNEYMGDIRAHIFDIMRAPIYAVDNVYEDGGNLYWKQNYRGNSFITLDYACIGCHIEIDEPLTMEDASAYATRIHINHPAE